MLTEITSAALTVKGATPTATTGKGDTIIWHDLHLYGDVKVYSPGGNYDLLTTLNGKQGTIQTTEGTNRNTNFGNDQRVQTSADNRFRIQKFDGTATTFSDSWKDQVKLAWNNSTKKTTVTVDNMIAGDSLETPAITLNGTNLGTTVTNMHNSILGKEPTIQNLD